MNKLLKNRVQTCVCGSGKNTTECCLALLEGVDLATSAEQLMRSRYTAYVLGKDEYLLQSWHVSTRPQTLNLENTLQWCGLKVLNVSPEIGSVLTMITTTEFGRLMVRFPSGVVPI